MAQRGVDAPNIQFDSSVCVMGILVWMTSSCKTTVMNMFKYISLMSGALHYTPLMLYFLPHVIVIIADKTLKNPENKQSSWLQFFMLEKFLDINQNEDAFSWSAYQ